MPIWKNIFQDLCCLSDYPLYCLPPCHPSGSYHCRRIKSSSVMTSSCMIIIKGNRGHLFGQNDFNPQYIFISACSSPGLLWGDGGQLVHGLQDHHRLHVIVSCFVIWTLSKNDLPPFFWSILLFFERSQFICNISRIEEIFLRPWVKSISVTIHIHVSQSFLTKTQSWYLHRI